MNHAEPHANIPDHPDPVAPQKFADTDVTSTGRLFLYDSVDENNEEWMASDSWVDARDHR